jgi:DnaJ like chaperone protein
MRYPNNIGCLWGALILLLIGGTPLLVGILQLFGVLVALLFAGGFALSWWIRRQAVLRYAHSQTDAHNKFVEVLVALLVRLAEVDAPINRGEVTAIRRFFQDSLGYRDERLLWIRDLIKASRGSAESVESLCARLRASYGFQERFIALQVLVRVAEADGRLGAEERKFIERVALELGLRPFVGTFGDRFDAGADRAHAESRTRARNDVSEALATLGLPPDAPGPEVKAAWRKLSLDNHPDRVAHLGPEFRSLAEERMRKINHAYTRLKEAGRVE